MTIHRHSGLGSTSDMGQGRKGKQHKEWRKVIRIWEGSEKGAARQGKLSMERAVVSCAIWRLKPEMNRIYFPSGMTTITF